MNSVDEAVKIGLQTLVFNGGSQMDKRMVDQEFHNEDTDLELSLRPTQLKQYIGQSSIKVI